MPLLQLAHELGNESLERLETGFVMRCRLLEPKSSARRWLSRDCRQRLRLSPQRAVERVDHVFGSPESPRQRKSRYIDQRADGLETKPFQRSDGLRIQAKCGNGKGRELVD